MKGFLLWIAASIQNHYGTIRVKHGDTLLFMGHMFRVSRYTLERTNHGATCEISGTVID